MVNKKHNRYGIKHTAKTRKKMSAATKRQHAEGVYANAWTDERRAKQSLAMKKYWRRLKRAAKRGQK